MLYTSVAPQQLCYFPFPNPIKFHQSHRLHPSSTYRISTTLNTHHSQLPTTNSFYPLSAINSCNKEQEKIPNNNNNKDEEFYSSIYIKNTHNRTQRIEFKEEDNKHERGSLPNMWWVDLKAALGQRINVEGLVCSVSVISRKRELAIPHVYVRDIRYIDWGALKRDGFQGVVFDKDNTLTVPYTLSLWAPLASSLESCKSVFGNNIAVFSNSAGLHEYDPDGRKARALEFVLGIKVIRHKVKKPAGSADEIERHFGCDSSRLIMVGDRPFTDIVYGNRNGFLTILTEPLSLAEEPFIVKQVRKLELTFVNWWSKRGAKVPSHNLLPDAQHCVKDLPPL